MDRCVVGVRGGRWQEGEAASMRQVMVSKTAGWW